jgi:hypothetical protein
MLVILKHLYYSFPIQLLLLSFKRNQFLLFFWAFILAVVVGKFGAGVGTHSVLLNPEYLGKEGYLSFALVGMGFGVMYVTWNTVMYILHSYRFPFMASLQYPLGMFFLNNSIIPLVCITAYIISAVQFQALYEYASWWSITIELLGFAAGFAFVILLVAIYFNLTNKNTGSFIEANKNTIRKRKAVKRILFNEALEHEHLNRVDYYVTNTLRVRHTRTVEAYDPKLHQLVFRRHHLNALIAFVATLAVLIAIGFFFENPFFQIPIAASGFLFFSVLMSLFGLFLYWTGGWGATAIIVFFIVANQLTKYDLFGYQSQVYGLTYDTVQADYSLKTFREISSDENIERDKNYYLPILENWKKKNTNPKKPNEKPTMYFINVSGGGLRAAMFTTIILQQCDSLAGGNLFDKTFMISGASGGMFGVTYLRELFLHKKEGFPVNLQDPEYAMNVSKDLLNPIALTILSNDALLPYHKFKVGKNTYFKDRGYSFEKFYCKNTDFRFDKTIGDYKEPEYSAKVPVVVYHTTIMNDSRRYYISPHPVSFLMRPHGKNALDNYLEIDAVDFCKFFEKQGGENLLVTSAMRMNATFPFILPNPVLPSNPPTYVMDGGASDNFGIETTLRFLKTFQTWINQNTAGVVIIQLRDTEKQEEPEMPSRKTLFERLTDPLGTVYSNMENTQDFLTDFRLDDMDQDLRGKLRFVLFEYSSEKKEDKAAMSMHLTTRDKIDILHSRIRPNNKAAFNKLNRILHE